MNMPLPPEAPPVGYIDHRMAVLREHWIDHP